VYGVRCQWQSHGLPSSSASVVNSRYKPLPSVKVPLAVRGIEIKRVRVEVVERTAGHKPARGAPSPDTVVVGSISPGNDA